MGTKEPSRHTAYFEVLDARRKGGCPICTLALAAVARYLDTIISIALVAGKQGVR